MKIESYRYERRSVRVSEAISDMVIQETTLL